MTDDATWIALEAAVNVVMSITVVVPTSTAARCSLTIAQAGETSSAVRWSMCTPDLSPIFNEMVLMWRSLGAMGNRWLNMVYLLITQGPDAQCPMSMDIAGAFVDPIWDRMAGSNQTVIVQLTDTLFARYT